MGIAWVDLWGLRGSRTEEVIGSLVPDGREAEEQPSPCGEATTAIALLGDCWLESPRSKVESSVKVVTRASQSQSDMEIITRESNNHIRKHRERLLTL